jgi:hypothetical protein
MTHDSNCECVICAPLPTGTHYRRLGETEWHTVGEPPTRIASEEHNVNDKEDDMIDDDIHDYAPRQRSPLALRPRSRRLSLTRLCSIRHIWGIKAAVTRERRRRAAGDGNTHAETADALGRCRPLSTRRHQSIDIEAVCASGG